MLYCTLARISKSKHTQGGIRDPQDQQINYFMFYGCTNVVNLFQYIICIIDELIIFKSDSILSYSQVRDLSDVT